MNIQNPGSALGEAIGAQMEAALNSFLKKLVQPLGCHYISKGLSDEVKAAQSVKKAIIEHESRKLLLYDKFGTAYNIDSVITNESLQPLILVESKYIRYKKHNRDKGSWVCTAHPAIRKRYASVRSSIAVLAGNWSSTSVSMMKSFEINIFQIPFAIICELLSAHDIDFNWGEKDRETAKRSWKRYVAMRNRERLAIGQSMVKKIEPELKELVLTILDNTIPREIKKVEVELHSNIGEVKAYEFSNVAEAVDFLNREELRAEFLKLDGSVTLLDPPPKTDDED